MFTPAFIQGVYPEISGRWRLKGIGKSVSASSLSQNAKRIQQCSWGPWGAVSPLIESMSEAQEAPAIVRYLQPENN